MNHTSDDLDRASPPWWDHHHYILERLQDAVRNCVQRDLPPGAGRRVVDIGCGRCPYRTLFEERGYRYCGCDLDGEVDVRFEPGKSIGLADACADVVVSFQVLEHVWELDWYLGECRRLLKPDGCLLLSTHGAWLYHPHPGDYRRWTEPGLTRELLDHGFDVMSLRGIGGPLAWSTYIRLAAAEYLLARIPLLGPVIFGLLAAVGNVQMAVGDALTPAASRQRNACVYLALARKSANLPPRAGG